MILTAYYDLDAHNIYFITCVRLFSLFHGRSLMLDSAISSSGIIGRYLAEPLFFGRRLLASGALAFRSVRIGLIIFVVFPAIGVSVETCLRIPLIQNCSEQMAPVGRQTLSR